MEKEGRFFSVISRISMHVGWLILWNQSGHNRTKVATEIKNQSFYRVLPISHPEFEISRVFETGGPFSTKMQLSYNYGT